MRHVRVGSKAEELTLSIVFRFAPDTGHGGNTPTLQVWARNGHGVYSFIFPNGLATSRAHSMKRSTGGLNVRFFSVTIAYDICVGNTKGSSLRAKRST